MKTTYLDKANIEAFVTVSNRSRLRDIVQFVKENVEGVIPQGRGGRSYIELFESIIEHGTLAFRFDEGEVPDADNELGTIRVLYTVNGETYRYSTPYVDAIVKTLPTRPENNETENGKMKKVTETAKTLGTGALSANKAAFGMAGKMQAGRASNKAVKEAVRPLVKLMFKPSFMQRLLAKVFKKENPIDTFLDSPYGSLFAANMAQLALQVKGVENEKAQQVVIGGIAYAYNELGDLIPVEKTIDEVIKKLTEAGDKIVS